MSLINDALKRASEVQPTSTLDPHAVPLLPADPAVKRSTWTWVWYSVALMGAGVLASWAMVAGYLASRELKLAAARNVAAREMRAMPIQPAPEPTEKAKPVQEVSPVVPATTNTAPQSAAPAAGTNNFPSLVPPSSAPSATAMAEPPKPVAPTFKLQAIFYHPANPQAMINSKNLRRGDKVLDARVLLIDRNSVTLQRGTEKLVLTLPE